MGSNQAVLEKGWTDRDTAAQALLQDEAEMLNAYRKAKRLGHADLVVTIQEGTRVKLWLTEKMR